jgi:hypothetical protein
MKNGVKTVVIKNCTVVPQSSVVYGGRGGLDDLGIMITKRETAWYRYHTKNHHS